MDIKIRLATSKDIKGLLKVKKITWLDTYPNDEYKITKEDILSKDFDSDLKIKKWEEMARKNNPTSRVWVAEFQNKIVGFCTALKEEKSNGFSVYVLPKFQAKGLGMRFLNKIFKWLGSDKPIKIKVAKYNLKAINFYLKYGFKNVRTNNLKIAKFPSGKIMPLILMVK